MSPDAIEVAGLSVTYRGSERKALDGVALSVGAGELVAVLGGTGAGKTTLCRAICGLVPHAIKARVEGDVRVARITVAETGVAQLSRHVGSVFQDAESQIFGLTVESDVAFGLENFATSPPEIRERVDLALGQVRMETLAERPSYELSGGQKQRLVIAAALAMRPPVLVLDEPTAELDPVGKRELLNLLAELSRQGTTVLVAEQMTDGIAESFDRAFVLDKGKLVASGPARELLGEVPTLQSAGVRPPQISLALHLAFPDVPKVPATLDDALDFVRLRQGENSPSDPPATKEPQRQKDTTLKAIEVDNVTYSYPTSAPALKGVSLTVAKGEMIALAGENGAGKSTFVRHLTGLIRPESGSVRIDGDDVRGQSVAELARRIGYVFQNPDHQIWAETLEEELAFGPRNLGMSEEETTRNCEYAMRAVRLDTSLDEHPNLLGQGERQKLAIASVLAMNPEILVLDEPTTGLDWQATTAILDLVTTLNEEGRTIVVITHDMWVLAEYVPRTVVMSGGRVIGDGPTQEIMLEDALLERAYLEAPASVPLARSLGSTAVDVRSLGAEIRYALKTGRMM